MDQVVNYQNTWNTTLLSGVEWVAFCVEMNDQDVKVYTHKTVKISLFQDGQPMTCTTTLHLPTPRIPGQSSSLLTSQTTAWLPGKNH